MIQAADPFLRTDHKLAPLHATVFSTMQRLSLINITFVKWSRLKRSSQHLQFFSNEDLADKEHHTHDNVPFHDHDASFRLRREGKIMDEGGER